jgi:catechol 2,3-dioxygenase-like lactoylglutathione lyase family enzyme
MFQLTRVFHVSHVVDDLDRAMTWYDKVFSTRLWQRSELFGTSLALLVVGDLVLMPMQPATAYSTAPGRFRDRFGPSLHSLALYVDRPTELIERLRDRGLRLTGADGGELRHAQDEIWTQPRQTPVLLEFFEPRASMNDPRLEDARWSPDYWRRIHPLGIIGSYFTVVAADAQAASEFFIDVLGGKVIHRGVVPGYGTQSTFVSLSRDVTIEVAEPTSSDGDASRDLRRQATFHAVTFRVTDLMRAVDHLEANGVRTEARGAGHVALRREDCLGVNFRLTDRDPSSW